MGNLNFEEQLDEKTKKIISDMENEIQSRDKEIEAKSQEIRDLKNQLEYLKNQILNKNKKIFGKSSEQVDTNQLSIFNEAEQYYDAKTEEPNLEEITYKRKKTSSYVGKKDNLANLKRIVIEHKLDENEAICDKCGEQLVVIG